MLVNENNLTGSDVNFGACINFLKNLEFQGEKVDPTSHTSKVTELGFDPMTAYWFWLRQHPH